ncbi:GAF domain-containing protein [Candidatus Leptofilum sp.]|uniref:GAF domain-containing protein n=1 Tax=Candidatus Leptofilum sp. TaxID=3241576 RepID=UPI003B58FA6E
MNNSQQSKVANQEELRARNAKYVVNVVLAGVVAATLAYLIIAWQTQAWQIYILTALLFSYGGLALVARRYVQNGRIQPGITRILGGMFVLFPVTSLLVADLGSVLGLALVGLVIVTVLQTLPAHTHTRFIALAVGIGILTYLLDIFGGDYRQVVPQLQSVIIILTALVLVIFTVFIVRGFSDYSLRTKLILAFLTLSLLSGGVVTLFTTNTIQANLLEDIGNNLHNVADTRATAIGDLLSRQADLLNALSLSSTMRAELAAINPQATLAQLEAIDQQWRNAADSDPLIQDSLNHPLALEMLTFQARFPQHVELFITDSQGALLATTNRTSDYYQADEEWWQVAYANGQGATFISQPEFDESSNALALQMAVPIFAPDNSIVGILRTTYETDALTELLAAGQAGESLTVDVYLPDGRELELEEGRTIISVDDGYEQWHTLAESNETIAEVQHDNDPTLASAILVQDTENRSEIANLDWVLTVTQPEAVGLAAVTAQQRNTVLLIIGVALLSIIVAFGLSGYLTRPVYTLADAVNHVRSGNLDTRVSLTSGDEFGELGRSFNDMTAQLQQSVGRLERRNRVIETSTEIGRRLSTILEPQQLFIQVVEQVQSTFDYYHAHIYLLDDSGQSLTMVGGTGQAGAEMLAKGHVIPINKGLVGRAATTKDVVLIPDVSQAPNWLPNPLLPETKAEVAVPITVGDRVLGVLDVQHNVVNGLQQLDVELLQAVVSQVAIALQNARSYAQAKQKADQEAVLNTISQKIETATSIETVLDVAARELRQALGAKHTIVELGKAVNGRK